MANVVIVLDVNEGGDGPSINGELNLPESTKTYIRPKDMVGGRATYDHGLGLVRYRVQTEPGLVRIEMTKLGPAIPLSNRLLKEEFLVELPGVGPLVRTDLDTPSSVTLWVARRA